MFRRALPGREGEGQDFGIPDHQDFGNPEDERSGSWEENSEMIRVIDLGVDHDR
jgi:hypothetical protein